MRVNHFHKLYIVALTLVVIIAAPVVQAAEVSPMSVEGATTIDVAAAKQLFNDGVIFVDVRSDSDYDAGRIPEALHLNIKTNFSLEILVSEVKKDQPMVLYCNGEKCLRSSDAAIKAVEWGWTNIYYFRDGFPSWKSADYPVE